MAHAHCMLDTYGYTPRVRICITYCFSIATMVARTHLNAKLYYTDCLVLLMMRFRKCFGYSTSEHAFRQDVLACLVFPYKTFPFEVQGAQFKKQILNTFAASYLNTQGLNNSYLKSPASTLVDLTFQSRAPLFQLKSAT